MRQWLITYRPNLDSRKVRGVWTWGVDCSDRVGCPPDKSSWHYRYFPDVDDWMRVDVWGIDGWACGVPYTEEVVNIDGCACYLFQRPSHTQADIEAAKAKIRRDHDVVWIRVYVLTDEQGTPETPFAASPVKAVQS